MICFSFLREVIEAFTGMLTTEYHFVWDFNSWISWVFVNCHGAFNSDLSVGWTVNLLTDFYELIFSEKLLKHSQGSCPQNTLQAIAAVHLHILKFIPEDQHQLHQDAWEMLMEVLTMQCLDWLTQHIL